MTTLHVGIIGTGTHGMRYATHILQDVPDLQLTAIARRSEIGKKQAETLGCRWHQDWQDLVDDRGVDAIIAVTPPNINLAVAKACVVAQKPLLIEKPLAINNKEASLIVELFHKAGLPLTVSQTQRFNTVILTLKKELTRAGDLHSFNACQRLETIHHPWLDNLEIAGGGVILHSAVHLFDSLRFITGREVVRVRATSFKRHNSQTEDLVTALFEMDGGLVGIFDASKVGAARSARFEFVGTEGQLQGDQVHGFVEFINKTTITPILREKPAPTIIPLLNAWRNFLVGKDKNPIPGKEGLAAIRICDACRISATEDRWINLADLDAHLTSVTNS